MERVWSIIQWCMVRDSIDFEGTISNAVHVTPRNGVVYGMAWIDRVVRRVVVPKDNIPCYTILVFYKKVGESRCIWDEL